MRGRLTREAACCGCEQSALLGRSSGEFDAANPDADFLDPVGDCAQGSTRFVLAFAQIIYPSGKLFLGEHGLQRFGNPVGKTACNRQQLLEQRNAALQGGAEFVVGEPDEVFEVRGNQFARVGVGEVHLEPYART